MSVTIPDRVAQRAFENWTEGDGGCHISTYSTQSSGYAQIGWWADGKSHMTTAHRAAWVHVHGQIEGDMDVDHRPTCDYRCVNDEHLRLLTPQDNRRRQYGDWPLGECRRGHPDSMRVPSTRGTRCGECHREESRERYRNKQLAAV